jgi:hypothetical protein
MLFSAIHSKHNLTQGFYLKALFVLQKYVNIFRHLPDMLIPYFSCIVCNLNFVMDQVSKTASVKVRKAQHL